MKKIKNTIDRLIARKSFKAWLVIGPCVCIGGFFTNWVNLAESIISTSVFYLLIFLLSIRIPPFYIRLYFKGRDIWIVRIAQRFSNLVDSGLNQIFIFFTAMFSFLIMAILISLMMHSYETAKLCTIVFIQLTGVLLTSWSMQQAMIHTRPKN